MTNFIVKGMVKSLEMKDSNGVDRSNEFIGNYEHMMEIDSDGNYIATDEIYQWWKKMFASQEKMYALIKSYKEKYGERVVDDWLEKFLPFDVDVTDQPYAVKKCLEFMDVLYDDIDFDEDWSDDDEEPFCAKCNEFLDDCNC